MEKKVSRVILNGNTIMDIHEDTVSEETLSTGETAHNSAGEDIVGEAQIVDGRYYKIDDESSTDLADSDYLPFYDVSDENVPKKKTLFSNLIEKLKATFAQKTDIKTHTYELGTEIPENANLNTYTTEGVYQCDSTATARTISNLPYSGDDRGAFKLVVSKVRQSTNLLQIFTPYNSSGLRMANQIAFRFSDDNGSTWSIWHYVAETNAVHYLSHIDTAHRITANQDLNDYTSPGSYQCTNATIASSLSNCPVNCSFKLIVDKSYDNSHSEIMQKITMQNSNNPEEYVRGRTYDATTWGEWKRYASTDDISPSTVGDGYAEGSVSGSAITATISGFMLRPGVIVAIKISNEISSACTLNINNTGAKNITYWNNENPSAGKLIGGSKITTFMYDGTYYRIIAIDRTPFIGARDYTANTSGKILIDWGYGVNRAQLKYNVSGNTLEWNKFKNGSWYGDRRLIDENHSALQFGTTIPDNSDLDNYTEEGSYNVRTQASAETMSNIPIEKSGKLIVMMLTTTATNTKIWKAQFYIPNHKTCLFMRCTTDTGWLDWKEIGIKNDLLQREYATDITSGDLNDYTTPGLYYWAAGYSSNIANRPYLTDQSCMMWVMDSNNSGIYFRQIVFTRGINRVYTRVRDNATWRSWDILNSVANEGQAIPANSDLNSFTAPGSFYVGTNDRAATISNIPVAYSGKLCVMATDGRVNQIYMSNNGKDVYIRHIDGNGNPSAWKRLLNSDDASVKVYVGTCTTAASEQVKIATVDSDFILVKGARISIKFTNSNTYNSTVENPCKLNVNNTGAKQIYYNNSATPTGTNVIVFGVANRYHYYMYDGTYWIWDGMSYDNNSTNFLRNDASSVLTASGAPYLVVKSSTIDITEDDNNVESSQYPCYLIQDKQGKDITRLESVVETNGQTRTYLQVCNYNTSTASHFRAGLTIFANKLQDVWYGLTNPHYFARAIGHGYGTCTTAADQQVKAVTCPRFILTDGAVIHVKFSNTNTYNSTTAAPCQLNVNGSGAKNIWYNAAHSGSGNTGTNTRIYGEANRTFTYMYDGTYWVWLGCGYEADTVDPRSLSFGYGTCDTAAATTAKVVTLGSYNLRNGGFVSVKFTNAVPANATMNINSKGAKAIYFNGSAIKADIIGAGNVATFVYDGTNYHLISVDRTLNLSDNYAYNNSEGRPSGLTFSDTDVKITQLTRVIRGDLVTINFNLVFPIKNYTSNTKLVTGFPKPYQTVFMETQGRAFFLTANGELNIRSYNFTSSATLWGCSLTYIKKA